MPGRSSRFLGEARSGDAPPTTVPPRAPRAAGRSRRRRWRARPRPRGRGRRAADAQSKAAEEPEAERGEDRRAEHRQDHLLDTSFSLRGDGEPPRLRFRLATRRSRSMPAWASSQTPRRESALSQPARSAACGSRRSASPSAVPARQRLAVEIAEAPRHLLAYRGGDLPARRAAARSRERPQDRQLVGAVAEGRRRRLCAAAPDHPLAPTSAFSRARSAGSRLIMWV